MQHHMLQLYISCDLLKFNCIIIQVHTSVTTDTSAHICYNSVGSVGSIDIPNGVGCFDGTISGSVVSYQCDKGYTLVGNTNQVCLSNGTAGNWSGEVPMCQSLVTHTHTHVTYHNKMRSEY